MSWIQTYSRKKFDYLNPRVEDVNWTDTAFGLARCDRWRGQTRMRYSTAAHSIHAGDLLRPKGPAARLAGLIHDTPEWCMGDWPTPLKMALRAISPEGYAALEQIESRVLLTIIGALRQLAGPIAWDAYYIIMGNDRTGDVLGLLKRADYVSMSTEARDLLPGGVLDNWTDGFPPATPEALNSRKLVVARSYTDVVADESALWASAWLTHVEDASGLPVGTLVPVSRHTGGDVAFYKLDYARGAFLNVYGLDVPIRRWEGV